MNFRQKKTDVIELVDGPGGTAALFAACSLTLLALTTREWLLPSPDLEKAIGGIVAFLGFAFATVLCAKRSVFRFERGIGQIAWRRRGLFGTHSGRLAFDEVIGVVVDCQSEMRHTPSYRVVLVTSRGDIPITQHYAGRREASEGIARRILELLDRPTERLFERSLEWFVSRGRTLPAVHYIIDRESIGLTEARERIRRIEVARRAENMPAGAPSF